MTWNRQPRGDERRWERCLVDVPLRVIADNPTGTTVIKGRGTKMSAGGFCLFALANLAVGDRIDVELVASNCDKPIWVNGVIRNRVVYLYGVEFLINQPEDRQQVTRLSHSFSGTTHLQSP
jgi:hypothetical protein